MTMFSLIFAILLTPVLLVKYYEVIKYKEKLDVKNWLYLILASFAVIAIFTEKVFKVPFQLKREVAWIIYLQAVFFRFTSAKTQFCVSRGRRTYPHLSATISYIPRPNTDELQNINSTFVTLIGFSSGLEVFQMPHLTSSPNVRAPQRKNPE